MTRNLVGLFRFERRIYCIYKYSSNPFIEGHKWMGLSKGIENKERFCFAQEQAEVQVAQLTLSLCVDLMLLGGPALDKGVVCDIW